MPFIEPKLEIAKGNYTNHSHIYQIGINEAVSTDWESFWSEGGIYPTSSIEVSTNLLHVSSSANEDTLEGVGARTITIEGLDANYNVVTETLNLQGKIAVSSSNNLIAINNAHVATGGPRQQSGSLFLCLSGSSTNLLIGTIDNEYRRLMQSHYTVPAGNKAYLQHVNCNVAVTSSAAEFAIFQRASGSIYRPSTINTTFGDAIVTNTNSSLTFDEKTEIDLRIKSLGSAGIATGQFSLILVSSSNIPVEPARIEGFLL
tara:strand:+ start:3274 stop:4050 length:777 start_codon:yes stop_codon:yes gene_type:complete